MNQIIRLGISSCLLGNRVRYDGGHQLDRFITETLGRYVSFVPVCPEVECGLGTPREAMRLLGSPENYRLVTRKTGIDHTARMQAWAARRLSALAEENLDGFIFKSRSPSSGMERVKIYGSNRAIYNTGVGLFAGAFMARFPLLPVEEDGRLQDIHLRENFIERLFVYRRWRNLRQENQSRAGLVAFHTDHKLLIMAHSVEHYRQLGRLVAGAGDQKEEQLFDLYEQVLTEALRLKATTKKR